MQNFKTKLKEKFDWDVTALPAYVNEESDDIWADLIYGSGLTSRVNTMTEVKGSETIKLLNVDFDLQSAASCGLVDDGTITFDGTNLTTVRVGVQFSMCNEDLNGTWAQMLNAIGAQRQDEEMPIESVITAYVIKKARKKNQDLMLLGNTASGDANLAFYDGFVKLFMNSTTINVATRTGATFSSSNAFQNFLAVYNAIPSELFDNEIPVEIITGRNEIRFLIEQVYNDKDFDGNLEVTDEGGELIVRLPTTEMTIRSYPQLNGLNQAFAVPYQFMFWGTDAEADLDGFFIKYLEDSEVLRYGMKWRSGVQWVYEDYFVRLANAVS